MSGGGLGGRGSYLSVPLQYERDGNTPAAEYQAPHPPHKTLSSKSLKLNYTVTAPGHIHTESLMLCHCWCNHHHLYSLVCWWLSEITVDLGGNSSALRSCSHHSRNTMTTPRLLCSDLVCKRLLVAQDLILFKLSKDFDAFSQYDRRTEETADSRLRITFVSCRCEKLHAANLFMVCKSGQSQNTELSTGVTAQGVNRLQIIFHFEFSISGLINKTNRLLEVSLSKTLNPRVAPDVQLAPCVAALPSVRVLQWAGDSSRVFPWPSPIHYTGFGPSNSSGGMKKWQHPATLTDKRKENGTEGCWLMFDNSSSTLSWRLFDKFK